MTNPQNPANGGRRPSPETIVEELTLTPPPAARGAPMRAGVARPSTYKILRTNQVDPYDSVPTSAAAIRSAPQMMAAAGDGFNGTARKSAKISIANGDAVTFPNVSGLIATLPSDAAMVHHKPRISNGAASKRVKEEQRNVRLRAWIFAASREADNDFHLIVGQDPALTPVYMTMEVSGLPPHSSEAFGPLKKVRDAFKEFLKDRLPGTGYDFYDPAIPVEIGGSLFFDIQHATGGRPGPQDLRGDMPVLWEIHPITDLIFEPA